MDIHIKKKIKMMIMVLSMFILVVIFLNFHVRVIAYQNGIVNIDSIDYSPPGLGPIYTSVLGKDAIGRKKGIWMKKENMLSYEVVYSEDLNAGITENDVYNILLENNVNNISQILLVFISSEGRYNDEDSIYWIATDEDNGFNKDYAIIDFYSGQIVDINTQEKGY